MCSRPKPPAPPPPPTIPEPPQAPGADASVEQQARARQNSRSGRRGTILTQSNQLGVGNTTGATLLGGG